MMVVAAGRWSKLVRPGQGETLWLLHALLHHSGSRLPPLRGTMPVGSLLRD